MSIVHPEKLRQVVDSLARRLLMRRSQIYKAIFLQGDGRTPTYEGNRALADLRKFAMMDRHAFLRDGNQSIDPLSMARIEGRREVVRRIEQHIQLDEAQIRELVEVKDE